MREPVVFAPRPPASELRAHTAAEREAGIVILAHDIHLQAYADQGQEFTEEFHQLRYLILDDRGSSEVGQHVFFSADDDSYQVLSVDGQTLAADGSVIALDPQRDMQLLDARDRSGTSAVSLRSVTFPRVAPGAVLDLAYRTRVDGIAAAKFVQLQRDFPTRHLDLRVSTRTDDARRWVPVHFGPLPSSAEATLNARMDFQLRAHDVSAQRQEPFAPPETRRDQVLALLLKEVPESAWLEHLTLWEPTPPMVTGDLVSGPLGEAARVVDTLGIQGVPTTLDGEAIATLVHDYDPSMAVDEVRFLRQRRRAESATEIASLAPSDRPWHQRAEALFRHARERLRVNPFASHPSLDRALRDGVAAPAELSLYFQHLLDQADIPNQLTLVLSRKQAPFSPAIGGLTPYRPRFMVRAGPPGRSRYYPIADLAAGPRGFSPDYLASVAFVRQRGSGRWVAVATEPTTAVHDLAVIEVVSALPLTGGPTDLDMRLYFEGAAATAARTTLGLSREALELPRPERLRAYANSMVDVWAGQESTEDAELSLDPAVADPLRPLQLSVHSRWTPAIVAVEGGLLVSALPDTWRTSNPFTALQRTQPLWLAGGDFDLRMRWRLPDGYRYAGEPITLEREGPAGLYFSLTVIPQSAADGRFLVSRLVISEPYMVSADDYEALQRFFDSLQREVDRRRLLLVPST